MFRKKRVAGFIAVLKRSYLQKPMELQLLCDYGEELQKRLFVTGSAWRCLLKRIDELEAATPQS